MGWSSKCGGGCCTAFCLSVPWDDIVADFEEWKRGNPHRFKDVWLAVQFFKPLGLFSKHPTGHETYDPPQELFACTMLGDDGLCTVYENRPHVCSDYPGKHRCSFPGCRSEAATQFPLEAEA